MKDASENNDFEKGYACACATLAKAWGQQHLALMLLHEGGFSVDHLKEIGAEECDIEALEERGQ
jgi:hypothetical protein